MWYRIEAELRREVEKHGSIRSAAAAHNLPATTVQNWAKRYGIVGSSKHTVPDFRDPEQDYSGPPPLIPIQDEELRFEGDGGVASDWHAPLTHYETLHRFLDDCVAHDFKRVFIPGDLTNQDALATHEDKQAAAHMEAEMEHLSYAVSLALDAVDELVVSLGNHDRHLARNAKVSFDTSIRMLLKDLPKEKLDRITVTARDYVIVDTEEGEWRLCHTRSYSRIALAYPMKLAVRWNQHIAAGHRHHFAQGYAPNGKMAVDLGGLQDDARMSYVHRYTNDLPAMQNGYGLLVGGRMHCPMLYS